MFMQNFILFKLTNVEIYQTKYIVYTFTEIWSLVASYMRKFDFRPIFYVNLSSKGQ